ncbi:MAG: hypothetical protein AAGG07_10280 [Planctomycetota bacterium]
MPSGTIQSTKSSQAHALAAVAIPTPQLSKMHLYGDIRHMPFADRSEPITTTGRGQITAAYIIERPDRDGARTGVRRL